MSFRAPPSSINSRGLAGWLAKAGVVLLWALAVRLLATRLGLPASPAGDLAPLIGLDRPVGWVSFLSVLAPLGLLMLSAAGHGLAAWAGSDATRRGPRLGLRDWAAYLCLPLMLALSLAHGPSGLWALGCGAVFLLALAWQTGLAAGVLWEAAAAPEANRRLLAWGSALLGLALFWALGLWVMQAVTTCGDEPIYLIDVDRLLASCGLSAGDAALKPMRFEFYWGGWSKFLAQPPGEAWLLRLLLAPGWLIAGRMGAMGVLGLAGALTLGLTCSLALKLGYRGRVALGATWLLGFTLPLSQLTQHIYPGVFGVLGVIAGLALLAGLPRHAWWRLLGLAAIGLGLLLIKFRLAPIALGLALATGAALYMELPRWRAWIAAGCALAVALALGLFMAAWWEWTPWLTPLSRELRGLPPIDFALMWLSLPAMLLDQQFGLMAYAPWLLLGLAGAARFGRKHPRMFLYSLLAGGTSALVVMAWRWLQWFGGFAPPGRFLAPLLPVLALWALPALARGGRLWRAVVAWLGLVSLGMAYVFTLIPQWRFHRRTGINNLLAWWGDRSEGVVHRFLPSFNDHAWQLMVPVLPWLALVLVGAVYLWRDPRPDAARQWSLARLALAAGGCLLAGLLLLSLAGRNLGTEHVEAESLRTSQSRLYGDYYDNRVQLVLRSPKDVGRARVVVPPGVRGLDFMTVRHAKAPREDPPPTVAFYLDGRELGRMTITAEDWTLHRLDAPLPPGVHTLEVRLLSHNGRDVLGLDFLELR
ncbi:MAG: hypothetical protein K9K66_00135 [Desulfarculaceae bacterium]|nr:hypothetical protein [Desulfarculaceae bacterium]MCF8072119.1 hypothetical protein [Desulfarculaceae bacterium]MCF8100040.1 hypothetical protein [Desulfarculaceae bacterium]